MEIWEREWKALESGERVREWRVLESGNMANKVKLLEAMMMAIPCAVPSNGSTLTRANTAIGSISL